MDFTRFAAGLVLALSSLHAGAQTLVDYGSRQQPALRSSPPVPAGKGVAAAKVATLNEGFDDITTLAAAGWSQQNLSAGVGSTNWFQGNTTVFSAFAGAATSYIGANYNNTGSTGTINNWLITPELDFGSGATFTFYTRQAASTYADRLQVRLSINGASTNAGTGPSDVGDFTELLIDINPTLTGSGYPEAWTLYTISHATHPALPHSGTGRLALRYFVTSAGFSGTNSDYIGIDSVTYNTGAPEYQVGGTVSGLAGSGLTLSLNGGAAMSVNNGAFTFPPYLASGASYDVTVASQPGTPSQTCSVSDGSGTIAGTVTNVSVTCVTDQFSIGGNVSGLAGSGLVLQLNGGNDLPIAADGSFTFPQGLDDLSNYDVTVSAQPVNLSQTCTVTDGSGTLASANVSNVQVACATNSFTIGGTVTGLAGSGLVLQNNGGDDLSIAADGSFTFTTPVIDGGTYMVGVSTQPGTPTQTCTIADGAGIVAGADVTDVAITCSTHTFTVGGTVTGLLGAGLVLQNNGGDDLSIAADGGFTFSVALLDLSSYSVTIATQPSLPAQTCTVSAEAGALSGADVTDVAVTCTTDPFTLSVVSGSGQSALFNVAFAQPLSALLVDGNADPVAGATVTFTAPAVGASAQLDDGVQAGSTTLGVLTDATGGAVVMATANATAGCYGVTASADGAATVAFELTNVTPLDQIFTDGFETPLLLKGLAVCQP